MSEAVKAIVIKITDDGIYIDAQRGKTNKYKPEHRAGSPSAALEKVGELLGLAPLKTCPRCTKRIAGEGVHTCTPTERWRVLELAIEDLMRDKYRLMRQRDELLAALERVLSMDVKGHELRDRLQFSRSGREILHECNSALTSVKAVTEPTKPKSCGTCKPCAHENSITQHTGDGTA